MLDRLTKETFLPHVGEVFEIYYAPTAFVSAVLLEVTGIGRPRGAPPRFGEAPRPTERPEGFFIVLRGDAEPPLRQGMYRLVHPVMGELAAVFLTVTGADERSRYYEALFN